MTLRKNLNKDIRGWLPKETTLQSYQKTWTITQKAKPEINRTAFKVTTIANAVLVNVFLGTHFLVDPFNRSLEIGILSWSWFIPAVIIVNVLIYRHFKKQTNTGGN